MTLARPLPLVLVLAAACGPDSPAPQAPTGAPAAKPASTIHFTHATHQAGLDFEREHGRAGNFHYVEQMIGGAIFFDAENDGDPDLYLLNGRVLDRPVDAGTPTSALFRNDGSGHFENTADGSGLADPRYSMGVCGGDLDNDGDTDLFVTNYAAPNALFWNDGQSQFTDGAAAAGVAGADCFVSSAALADVDRDGRLDLFVANCLDATLEHNPVCEVPLGDGSGMLRRYCAPMAFEPVPDQLFRNLGDGCFQDVSVASGIAGHAGRSLGSAFADFDADGDPDLFVACDKTPNLYFENLGDGTFRERAEEAGVDLGADGQPQAGMGITTADFDGDARIDVAVTYFEWEWNGFYRNVGSHQFREVATGAGTRPSSLHQMGWGIEFFDADLDADLDVMVANGHLQDDIALLRDPVAGYEQPNLLYENRGDGRFHLVREAGPGHAVERVSRGLATADVDGDGDLDVLIANLFGAPDLLINETPRDGNHWLIVRTRGTRSNRDGIGARVEVYLGDQLLVREVRTGQSYLSQSDLRVHFGLGEVERVPRLEVKWPSGTVSVLQDVAVDQVLEVVEPES